MPFVVRVEVQLADVSLLLSVLQFHVLIFVRLDLSVDDELLNFHKVFQPLLLVLLHSVVFLAPCGDPVRFLQGVPLPGAIIYVTLSLRHFLFIVYQVLLVLCSRWACFTLCRAFNFRPFWSDLLTPRAGRWALPAQVRFVSAEHWLYLCTSCRGSGKADIFP